MNQKSRGSSQSMSKREQLNKANPGNARVTKYSVEELLAAGKLPNFSKRKPRSEKGAETPPSSSEDPEAG